jgi:FkbM family methyltransferase
MDSFDITKEGYAVIPNDTHISKWVKENQRLDFDQNALPFILEHINKNDFVIDCGANIGAYSFAFLNKGAFVLSFEPNKEAFDCLKYNLKDYPNSHIFNYAVGAFSGKVNVIKSPNAGASICERSKDGDIELRAIDSFNLERVDFIKIDVEGFELDVLRGAVKTIQKFKPKLYIEINEGTLAKMGVTPKNVFDFLDLFKYEYSNIYKEQKMEGLQYDIICW